MKKSWLEMAALAAIILGIITGVKVLGGAVNLRVYTFVVMAVFVIRLDAMAGIVGRNARLWIPMFLFLLAGLASIIGAINIDMGIKQLVLVSTFMLVPLAMTALVVRRPANVSLTLFWLILGAFAANVNGYLDPFYRFKALGWVGFFGRPLSFFTEANEYGQFMVMAWGYLLAMLLLKDASRRLKFWGLLSSAFMFPVFLINNSRGSYLGFAFECMLMAWLLFKAGPRRYFLKVSFSGAAFFIAALMLSYYVANLVPIAQGRTVADVILDRMLTLGSNEDETVNLRANQQKEGYQAFLDNPWTGAGLGNIMYYLNNRIDLDNSGVQKGPIATTAFWLTDLLGETGIFGTLAMGMILFILIQQAYRNYLFLRGHPLAILAAGNFLSMNGMILNGISYPPIYLAFFWLNVGICTQLSHLREKGIRPGKANAAVAALPIRPGVPATNPG